MKKLLVGAAAVLAVSASPAMAQAVIGGGVGGNVGTWDVSGAATHIDGNLDTIVNVELDRALSGSSVSGMAGSMDIGQLNGGGLDAAVFGGAGTASTGIAAGADLTGNGFVLSASANSGLYGGATFGNAQIRADFANAGQSSFSSDLHLDYDSELSVDFENISWTAEGTGFGFGGALTGGAQF